MSQYKKIQLRLKNWWRDRQHEKDRFTWRHDRWGYKRKFFDPKDPDSLIGWEVSCSLCGKVFEKFEKTCK